MNRYDTNSLLDALHATYEEHDIACQYEAENTAEEGANWHFSGGCDDAFVASEWLRDLRSHIRVLERRIDWIRDGLGLPPVRRR